jgi:large subunit ribosomal protein L20
LINGLLKAGVQVNRKMLADLALNDPKGFTAVVEVARKGLAGEIKPQVVEAKPVVKAAKVEKAAPVAEKVAEPQVELETLTVAQLKEVAQGLGLTGLSGLKKAELVEAIKAAQK